MLPVHTVLHMKQFISRGLCWDHIMYFKISCILVNIEGKKWDSFILGMDWTWFLWAELIGKFKNRKKSRLRDFSGSSVCKR